MENEGYEDIGSGQDDVDIDNPYTNHHFAFDHTASPRERELTEKYAPNYGGITDVEEEEESTTKKVQLPKEPCFQWSWVKYDDSYIRQDWQGKLKVLQLGLCVCSALLLPDVYAYHVPFHSFEATCWVTAVYCLYDLALHISSLYRRMPAMLRSLGMRIFVSGIFAITLLSVSSLMMSVLDMSGRRHRVLVATSFGYLTCAFFAADVALCSMAIRMNQKLQRWKYLQKKKEEGLE